MSRISSLFSVLKHRGSGAFVPYICAGDPSLSFSERLGKTLIEVGADMIEIGIPFSDPIADGPIIQGAMKRSLSRGFKTDHLFQLVNRLRGVAEDRPIIVMSYMNPIFRYGIQRFCESVFSAGTDGLLIVDLPLEESVVIDDIAKSVGLEMIRIVSSSSSMDRIAEIVHASSGFIYMVSVPGVTGPKRRFPRSAFTFLKLIKSHTNLPVLLGFGVSNPQQARMAVLSGAEGVVEGSHIIEIYTSNDDTEEALRSIANHVCEMKMAMMLSQY